jgi:hypothetical protein
MFIGTVAAANHLPKAACLARSLAQTQAEHRFVLCLVERDRTAIHTFEGYFSQVVLAADIGISNFDSFVFRHDRYEACTAVKAQFLLWAMLNFPEEQYFVFLDSDVMAYSRFEELEAILPHAEIVVTPHQVHDEESLDGIRDNTLRILIAGTFNTGLVALRRSPVALEFLEWWNRKLQILCYMEWRTRGLFVDQKWVLLALSFFDMTIFREPGYNVANWNISKRCLTACDQPKRYLVDGKPLRFFHFSNIDSSRDIYFFRRYLKADSPIFTMREEYLREVKGFDTTGLSRSSWSYGRFLSGEPIAFEARYAYRHNGQLVSMFPKPFNESSSNFFSALGRPSRQEAPRETPAHKRKMSILGRLKSMTAKLNREP